MPIHDWTRVDAGIFHDFHHEWITTIKHAVNQVLKGTNYYALAEQIASGLGPDVLTLQYPPTGKKPKKQTSESSREGIALAESPPKVQFRIGGAKQWYAAKKKAVTVRHVSEHRVVAVLEILSPGNKSGRAALAAVERKAQELLDAGVHLTLVDLFPPTPRDPQGIHPVVWDADEDDIFRFNPAKPLTCASYRAGTMPEAFVEPVAVGDSLPTMPLFLTPDEYVPVELEATYEAALLGVPDFWREALEQKPRRGKA
jgi:hypothetical protein